MASKNLSPTGKHAYPLDRIGTHLEIGDTECNNQEQGSTDADGHGDGDHASTVPICYVQNIGKSFWALGMDTNPVLNIILLSNLPSVET